MDPGVVSQDPCEPRPAPASGHRGSQRWSRAAAAACGNLRLLPEACSDKWHRGNSEREAGDKLSTALKGSALLGSALEDSKDVSLSSEESQQIFAGLCPSLPTRVPLGQLRLLFPVRSRSRGRAGSSHGSNPAALPCAREGWQCQLPFLPHHALLGLRIPDPECSHPIPPAAPGACGRDSSNGASNAPSYSASATVTAEVTSFQDIWPCPQPPPAQCHPQPLPSSASHPPLPSLCSWMDQLLPLPSPTASPTACSDIQALFNVCFASRKCSLVAGDGEGAT